MSVRDPDLRSRQTRRPIRTKEHQVMAHPRSDRPLGAIRLLVLWLLALMLVATQVAAPVVLAAPQAPDAAPAAAPSAPTNTITLDVFAARDEPNADIGPVTKGQAVTSYKWMINEDNTGTTTQRNANPGSGCSPADAGYPDSCTWTSIAGLRSSAPVVAQGDETTLNGTDGITLEPGKKYLVSVLADGYKLDGTPFSIPADPGTIEVPLQPLPLPTATATAEVFADVTSANGQYDPGEDGLPGFTGKLADYLGQVNTDVFGNPLCTTYKPGTGPNGYEWVDGGPVVLRQGGKCLSGDADMDGVVEGNVGGDDYNAWQASADPAIARGLLRIPNLGPNRYAMNAVAPTGESWVQTTTLEGNHDWDTWLMEGSTGYDTEFVVAGEPFPFTIFGYVPGPNSKYQVPTGSPSTYWQLPEHSFVAGGTGTITGIVSSAKVYVPAQGGTCLPGTIWGGLCGAKIDKPITDGWVALSDVARGDTAVKLVRADGTTGAFTITGVPAGTYTLTYWDEAQNHILDLVQVTVATGETQDLGILPLTGWFTKIDGYVFNDLNRNGRKDAGEPGVPGFGLTLRKRENSLMDRGTTAVATDSNGYYAFENAYPLTEWVILEAYSDSFYTTGVTYQADNQPTPTTMLGAGVDVSVLPIIGLSGRIDWGVHSYDALGTNGVDPQNGGIVGSVSYDTTRNELDPQYAAAEDWQPGVSGLTVELHGTVACGTHPGVPCDARGDYELAPDGSYARGQLLNTYVSETWERPTSGESGNDCLARDVDGTPLANPADQQVLPIGPNKGCLEGPLMGVQFGTYATDQESPEIANFGAAVDGNYGFGDGCFDGDLVVADPSAPICAVSGGSVTGPRRTSGTLGTPVSTGTLGTPVSTGTATGGSATTLVDTAATFAANGVMAGDLVTNTTDASTATVVTVVNGQNLTLTALSGGGSFDAGDGYTIVAADSATELRDPAATFVADDVAAGDIVTNTTDGSTATVTAVVSGKRVTTTGLTGGTDDLFQAGDEYAIVAAGSATDLRDPTATFVADDVAAGDIVTNTDGTTASVATVVDGQHLTLSGASGGDGSFDAGDGYSIVAGDSATELRDPTATFVASGVAVGDLVTNTTDGSTGTVAAIVDGQHLTVTALTGGADDLFQADDTYTIVAADSATVLRDPTATFVASGVVAGDIVVNTTDGSSGTVASRTGKTITLVAPLSGGTDFQPNLFRAGDAYVVHAATAAPSATVLRDATATFITDGVTAGDLVQNLTDGSTSTVGAVNSETQVTLAAALGGGTANAFAVGDVYAVGEVPFDALPADGYLVHLDLGSKTDAGGDPIYKVTREEDINIGNGDTFVPQVPPPSCAGPLHQVDVADDGTDGYAATTLPDPSDQGGFDLSVGASTPTGNPTFVDIGASPYEGTARPLCDTKLVDLQNGKSIVPMFNVFTDVPLPGRFFFYNVDDLNFSTDPKSLLYGEKAGMPFNPVGVYDWANRLVTTVETDYNGLADVLLPSTNRINCPTPSGVCANVYRFVGNDPGVPGRLNLNYNPQYRTIAAEFEAFPGLIVPADTAPTQLGVNAQLPGAQFNGPLVCRMNEPGNPTVPELYAVSTPYADLRTAGAKTFTIDGQGFGAATGTVALDGVALPTTSWSPNRIDVSVPATAAVGPHQLTITSATGATTVNGLTFHVLGFQAFPATGVLDTFTLPNGNGLGANWANTATSQFSIDGNTARNRATGAARWNPATNAMLGANQEAYFTFTDVAGVARQGLLLKIAGGNLNPTSTNVTAIEVAYKGTIPTAVQVRTKASGQSLNTATLQASFAASLVNGDKLGARALSDGTVIAYKGTGAGWTELGRVNVTATATPWPAGLAAGGGRLGLEFSGTSLTNDSHVDDFGGGNVATYTPNLYEVGPGLSGPNQFPAVQYDEGNPPHPVQDALDAAAASSGDDLVVVYPGLATPSNPRLNPRGAYYENLIVKSPVKLQGVGPGSADGSVQGSVIDGSAFGGDTTLAETWRVTVEALTRAGNQTVYEGPVVSVFAQTTSQYGSAFRAGIDGFDVRGGDQTNFPGNINQIGGGPTGLPPNAVTQGGGIFVNAYARYLQITNNVVESNAGSYAGGIRIGTPNLPQPDTNQHNENIRIAHNRVVTNGGTNLAGGIGLFAGADGYAVTGNDICGNSSAEYGGGISVYGYSPSGTIDHNRIWLNSSYDEGAGIMIAGELPADPLVLSPGTGPVDIHDNLVQANMANDDGGGIRFLMAGNFPMNVFNNMVVNNVSTHEGGGIAIDDAPDVRVYGNTIMKNLTTATAVTSTGAPAPAGLSTGANSALLQATLPVGSPSFSSPLLFNNIFWDNRAGTRSGSTVVGIGLAGDATPIDTWDLGVADNVGQLSPTNSVLQSQGHAGVIASPTNIVDGDPSVATEFDLSVSFAPWRTNPNFIGALLVAVDVPAGQMGDYHIAGTSPAVDTGAASKSGINAPAWDIDNDGRPNGAGYDIGADEIAGIAGPAVATALLGGGGAR